MLATSQAALLNDCEYYNVPGLELLLEQGVRALSCSAA